MASCTASGSPSCRNLVRQLNEQRRQQGLDVLDEDVFIRTIGDDPACTQTLQAIFVYASRPFNVRVCDGAASCSLTRDEVKRAVALGLLGVAKAHNQKIRYPSSSGECFFPLHLRNYFADPRHDGQRVTVGVHRLDQAGLLNPAGPFQRFSFRLGELGEDEAAVTVMSVERGYFNGREMRNSVDSLRLRHPDLFMASLLVPIPDDAAVLVSGFQSFSSVFGEPEFTGTSRQLLFLAEDSYELPCRRCYLWESVSADLAKAKAGFSAIPRGKPIEIGWAFRFSDRRVRLLVLLAAAADTGHELIFRVTREDPRFPADMIGFLRRVTQYHPQTVLRVLQDFLPHLGTIKDGLNNPEAVAAFLGLLAQQRLYQPAPLPSSSSSSSSPSSSSSSSSASASLPAWHSPVTHPSHPVGAPPSIAHYPPPPSLPPASSSSPQAHPYPAAANHPAGQFGPPFGVQPPFGRRPPY
jgi:hypothetical protein